MELLLVSQVRDDQIGASVAVLASVASQRRCRSDDSSEEAVE